MYNFKKGCYKHPAKHFHVKSHYNRQEKRTRHLFYLRPKHYLTDNCKPMYRFILSCCFGLCLLQTGFSQQIPQYALFSWQPAMSNPAYAGLDETLHAMINVRRQWLGIEGSPMTQALNVHMPLYLVGGGIGLRVENDALGPEQLLRAGLQYSYHLQINSTNTLGIGLEGQLLQYRRDGALLRTPDGDYSGGILLHNDAFLGTGLSSVSIPQVNVGVYWKGARFEAGAAVQNVLSAESTITDIPLQTRRHYLVQASGRLEVGSSLAIKPGFWLASDGVQTQASVSAAAIWNDKYLLGGGFRGFSPNTIDAVLLQGGVALGEKWMLLYGYDLGLSALRTAQTGSHEVGLRYTLGLPVGKGKLPGIIYNPRY